MSDKIDENFIEIDKNATDDTNNDETLGVVTEAIDSVKDKYENSDIQLLLNKIKELEKENKELKEEQQKTVPLGFDHHVYKYINDFDINANLKNLQEKFKERIHYFEGSVDSVKDRMKNVHLPEYKDIRMPIMPNIAPINLKPWIQMAAKSRKIDVALIEDAIPPKKRQLAATIVTFTLLPTCMFLSLVAIYIAIFIDETRIFTTLLAMYFIYMYVDNSHEHGSKAVQWFRALKFWKYLSNYFPIVVVKQNPDTVYDPSGTYMFGYHPHGIISVGCFVAFAADANGVSDMFPGIKIHPATLVANFFIPIWRDILIRLGVIGVSAKSLTNVLKKGPGNACLVVPGGAAEALDARPGKHSLTLQRRQGFFRIALQHGASLVPIYSFGENDLYDTLPNDEGSIVRKIQNTFLKYAGFATPFFSGAGSTGAALPMNPIPARKPIVTVIGDPIPCEKIEHPTTADINKIKALYIAKLQEMFTQFADTYAPERSGELEINK